MEAPDLLFLVLGMDFGVAVNLCKKKKHEDAFSKNRGHPLPEVLLIRKRAFVRFASPNILSVPKNEVLTVLTGLY